MPLAARVMDSARVTSLLDSLARWGVARHDLRRHGLGPLAYRAGYPEFECDFVANALLAERRARLVAEVVSAVSEAGVPVVLLKGVSYAGWLYEDPAERPMADVDVMVPGGRVGQAGRVLVTLGFTERVDAVSSSRLHHALTFQRGPDMIDLHRSIAQPGRVHIDLPAVWRRTVPCAERKDGALRLEPVDEALFHFVGVARTQLYAPAIAYVDGALLLERLTKSQHATLAERAVRYRVSRAVRVAADMTRTLLEPGYRRQLTGVVARLLPDAAEVARYRLPDRTTQLARKLVLLEGPRELAGYLVVSVAERLPILRDQG